MEVEIIGGPQHGKFIQMAEGSTHINVVEYTKLDINKHAPYNIEATQKTLEIHKHVNGRYVAYWDEPPPTGFSEEFTKIIGFMQLFLNIHSSYEPYAHRHVFKIRVKLPCPLCNETGITITQHVTDTGEKIKDEEVTCIVCHGVGKIESYISNIVTHEEVVRFFKG